METQLLERTLEENKVIARRLVDEVLNRGKIEVLDELVAPDVSDHAYAVKIDLLPGREGFKQLFSIQRMAFADMTATLFHEIAEGDLVVHYAILRATHTGDFFGIAPTGKEVMWTETHIYRMQAGKVVEHWANIDEFSLLLQLDVILPMSQQYNA